jgi:hypothetical protein
MSVSTGTHVETNVRTAVHLTDVIMGTFEHILAHLGLGSGYLSRHWRTIECGLRTWIAEGSLDDVRLECGDSEAPDAVFQVPISYRINGDGDIAFVTSQARLTRALAKLESVRRGSAYRVVVTFDGGHTHVDGWSPTSSAVTNGMKSYVFGSLGAGPDASASLTYFSRVR